MATLKKQIITLRMEGKVYNEISKILNCSKATISYHCKRHGVGNNELKPLSKSDKVKLNEYYKTHSINETALHFNVSKTTVIRYTNNKHIKATEVEIKIKNYQRVKLHRQKLKEKAIEYKGGCCVKCSYNKCNSALEFHHLNPKEKDFTVGYYKVLAWDKIKIELDKCILVCSNCHREIHEELLNCVVYPLPDTQ